MCIRDSDSPDPGYAVSHESAPCRLYVVGACDRRVFRRQRHYDWRFTECNHGGYRGKRRVQYQLYRFYEMVLSSDAPVSFCGRVLP